MAGLVERLIRVVASAFYSDECIVVLEALIREKFLKDDDRMGDAVNLQTRQVRKMLAELQQDHILSSEVLNDKHLGGASSTTYWYIDYNHFVNVVKYRLYKINEYLKEREQEEMIRQIYRCGNPGCNQEYTSLEAQRLIMPGQYDFRCGHCSDPLLECDNNERLVSIQRLEKKFKEQMNKMDGAHDGITEILRKLSEYVMGGNSLPNNLPSENRAIGVGGEGSRASNDRTSGNQVASGGGNAGGHANGNDKSNASSFLYPYGAAPAEIVVDIAKVQAEDDMLLGKRSQDTKLVERPTKLTKVQPEFLRKSTIGAHLRVEDEDEANHPIVEVTIPDPINSLDDGNSSMTEEQRQEAFKMAYMEELKRYNSSKHGSGDGTSSQQVQVELDKETWDIEENDDENEPDVEWEPCGSLNDGYNMNKDQNDIILLVQGKPKKLCELNDEDKLRMTPDEYEIFYEISAT